jgi:uncharacterized protein YggE
MKHLTLFLLGMVIMAYNAYTACADENQIFSVSADAIVRVTPDKVVLQIGAETRGEVLNSARQNNFDIIKNTIEILKRNGIEEKFIGTDHVDINTYYEDRDYRRLRFTVRQALSITINDISKYDSILAEVINAGINQIYGIEFQTDELKKHRYEARSLAIAAAKERAEFLAGEAGFQLGKIINLKETTNDYYWRPQNDRGGMSQSVSQSYNESIGESDTLAPGMISIRSNITLYYSVE